MPEAAKREPVDYRHDAINPDFLYFLAKIAGYAGSKYGDPLQYLGSRLIGVNGPVNHARNHIGQYQMGVPHDHFGPDPRWQLAAGAYNLMMEFVYVSRGEAPDQWPGPEPEARKPEAEPTPEREPRPGDGSLRAVDIGAPVCGEPRRDERCFREFGHDDTHESDHYCWYSD